MNRAKDVDGKPRYSLLPRQGLEAIIAVREYGGRKYKDDRNWIKVEEEDWVNAALRHLFAHLDGEKLDSESGLPHLHHAACSLLLASSIKPSTAPSQEGHSPGCERPPSTVEKPVSPRNQGAEGL